MEQLKVAYFAAPRRAALRTATPAQLRLPEGTGILSIQLSGSSAAEPPLVSLFELQHSSPLTGTPDVEGGGVLVLGQPADLQYVGITSDAGRVSNVDQSTVAFGLATYAPWAMPSEISFEIDIDTDRDGETDYVLATSDTGPAGSGGGPGDVFTIRLRSAGGSDAVVGRVNFVEPSVDTALYRSRVLTFGVRAGLLGLTSGKTHFNYRVRTYHLDVYDPAFNLTLVDQTPTLSYNLVSSGFSVPDRDPLVAGAPIQRADATRLTLSYRTQALEANETQGVLLLHHNNIVEQQAQVLSITHGASASLGVFLPLITSGTQ
jgi:hypothetical protein